MLGFLGIDVADVLYYPYRGKLGAGLTGPWPWPCTGKAHGIIAKTYYNTT